MGSDCRAALSSPACTNSGLRSGRDQPSLPMAEAIPLLKEGKLKAGVSIDKARVHVGFVTITDLIVEAYKVSPIRSRVRAGC